MDSRHRLARRWRGPLTLAAVLICGRATAFAADATLLHQAEFDPSVSYYVYVPSQYTADHVWPLVVAIHGGARSGVGDFDFWRLYAEREGFIVMSPNLTGHLLFDEGTPQEIMQMIGEVSRHYRVHPEKVFLSGCSWGSYFVYDFVRRYPTFAHSAILFPSRTVPSRGATRAPDGPSTAGQSVDFDLPERLEHAGYQVAVYPSNGWGQPVSADTTTDLVELFRQMRAKP